MMADEELNPLFAIDFSSDDSASETSAKQKTKVPRDFQSEDEFEKTKKEYLAKFENGKLQGHLPFLPIDAPSKQISQAILHAIEELYFHRRYQDALELSEQVLKGDLEADFKKLVDRYRVRCCIKLAG